MATITLPPSTFQTQTPPFGSWTQLGWRMGVDPTNATAVKAADPNNPVAGENTAGNSDPNLGAKFLQYGIGVPVAPTVVANMNHWYHLGTTSDVWWSASGVPDNFAGWLELNPAPTNPDDVPQFKAYYSYNWPVPIAPWLDNSTPASVNAPNANGNFALQFLTPVVPFFQVSATASVDLQITVFGYDWYGQPMQRSRNHTPVGAELVDLAIGGTGTTFDQGGAAFYGIIGAFLQVKAGASSITSLKLSGSSNFPSSDPNNPTCQAYFGLPYRLWGATDSFLYSDLGYSYVQSPTVDTPGGETDLVPYLVPWTLVPPPYAQKNQNPVQPGALYEGTGTVPGPGSPDPRGIVGTMDTSEGYTKLGYWVRGGDLLETIYSDQQRADPNTPVVATQDTETKMITFSPYTNTPMSWEGVYGWPQYWTGIVPDYS